MKAYLSDIIPKIQRFSLKLDDMTKLVNQHWVSIGDINEIKTVYIFRENNQLLISKNGIVEKGSWEYLGNQSLLLETKENSLLLKHSFFDQNVIALKLDSTDNYVFFVNENRYDKELNTIKDVISFLNKKYVVNSSTEKDFKYKGYKIREEKMWTDDELSKEQKEWIQNLDVCPACGYSSVLEKNECPGCGLNLL